MPIYPELPVNANPPPPFADTLLTISGWGQLIFQARDLTQKIEPIKAASQVDRDVNAVAIDLSNPAFRKYQTTITCTDRRPPPFDNFWPGMVVEVSCVTPLCYPVGNPGSPTREEVHASSITLNGFVFYLPILTMLVQELSWQKEDWRANSPWSLTLVEQ